jgi:hypothetical protein
MTSGLFLTVFRGELIRLMSYFFLNGALNRTLGRLFGAHRVLG